MPNEDADAARDKNKRAGQRKRQAKEAIKRAWRLSVRGVAVGFDMLRACWRWFIRTVERRGNFLVAIASVVSAMFAVAIFFTSKWQWETANTALWQEKLIFESGQRPWMHVQSVTKKDEYSPSPPFGTFPVILKNAGVTPAVRFEVRAIVRTEKAGDVPAFVYGELLPDQSGSVGIVGPQQTFTVSPKAMLSPGLTAEQAVPKLAGRQIWVFGKATYRDRFKNLYCLVFCQVGEPVIGTTEFRICDRYNDTYDLKEGEECPPLTPTPTPEPICTP